MVNINLYFNLKIVIKGEKLEIKYRTNEQIRGVYHVRLIDAEGKMIGIVPIRDALEKAQNLGLDLVELNRNSNPPVCKLLNFGKFKYEQMKQAKKKQHIQKLKEVVLRPVTDTHDIKVKANHIRQWLEDGDKVKIIIKMRGREKIHPEQGFLVLKELLSNVEQYKQIGNPINDGKTIMVVLDPI